MHEQDDMTPITRGELRAEFADFERRFELKIDQKFDQKFELWTGALIARFETQMTQMTAMLGALERRLMVELARHVRSIDSDLMTRISVVDDKHAVGSARIATVETSHAALEQRVERLEGEVFPPPVRTRARRRS